jgi:hypothetical protein
MSNVTLMLTFNVEDDDVNAALVAWTNDREVQLIYSAQRSPLPSNSTDGLQTSTVKNLPGKNWRAAHRSLSHGCSTPKCPLTFIGQPETLR